MLKTQLNMCQRHAYRMWQRHNYKCGKDTLIECGKDTFINVADTIIDVAETQL